MLVGSKLLTSTRHCHQHGVTITKNHYSERVYVEYFMSCISLVFMSLYGRSCLCKSISVVFAFDYLNFGQEA